MSAGAAISSTQCCGYLSDLDDGLSDARENLAGSSSSVPLAQSDNDDDIATPLSDTFRPQQGHFELNKSKSGDRYAPGRSGRPHASVTSPLDV
jgi:hypothetical protein